MGLIALLILASPTTRAEVPADPVREDVRGTATSIAAVHDAVRALSPEALQDARESARLIAEADPYARAAFLLAFALESEVSSLLPDRFDPVVRRDLEHLQTGLSDHGAMLRALDVPRPPADPQAGASGAIAGLWSARGENLARLDPHHDRLEALTGAVRPCPRGPWADPPGHPWTLGMHLAGWHDALRRVRPFVDGPEADRIDGLVALLEAWAVASRG